MTHSLKDMFLIERMINETNPVLSSRANLLIENSFNPVKLITENIAGVGKNYYISGIFSEFNEKNQNGRIYPEYVMRPEIERFYEKYVKTGRALGQEDHPEDSMITLEKVSHRIVDLWIEGSKVYGKALIGGPKGDDIKKILDMGGVVGVSSRALGSLNHKNEVTELQIITWDIVHEPSVASALQNTMFESKKFDWTNDKTGFITEDFKKHFKNINIKQLLTEAEKLKYSELYIKEFFKCLSNI